MNILNKIMLSFGAMMLSLSAQAVAAAPVAPIVDAPEDASVRTVTWRRGDGQMFTATIPADATEEMMTDSAGNTFTRVPTPPDFDAAVSAFGNAMFDCAE